MWSEPGIRCGSEDSRGNENRKSRGKNIFRGRIKSMKIRMMGLRMQIEGTKLVFIMNFSVLDFFKFASRVAQIAQILVSTFMPPDPPWYFLFFFSLAVLGSDVMLSEGHWGFSLGALIPSPPSSVNSFNLWKYWGFPATMVYLYHISCLRHTILVGNPQNKTKNKCQFNCVLSCPFAPHGSHVASDSTWCVAYYLHMVVPWPQEYAFWRQFVVHWGDC